MSRSELERIFDPRAVAVVGASADPAKRGHQIVEALAGSGYVGGVHPVNPRGGELLGLPVAPSVDELPDGVDLAVLCTPAAVAPELVRACGARGIAGAVVLAVGFGESGAEGQALEAALRRAGREAGVRVVGPNTSGLLNMEKGVNLVGARGVRPGGLAILVQSGNMALALMTEVTERSWDGVSIYLGVGNEIDVGFTGALEYLEDHEPTRAVLTYVEGFRDAGAFLEVAARVGRSKPVVLLKSGRTAQGAEAALSHTGSVTGPYDRLRAGFAQAGVVELTRADELLHVAETLGRQPAPEGDAGIAILSDGGGQGTLAVDWLAEAGARLAELAEETRHRLRDLLGPAAAVSNPVDLAGAADADPTVFGRAMEALVADPSVGTVLLVGLFGGYGIRFADSLTEAEEAAAEAMAEAARAGRRGFVVHTMYAAQRSRPLAALGARGVPVVGSLEVACRCVVELQRRGAWLEREPWRYAPPHRDERVGDTGSPSGRGRSRRPASAARHPVIAAARKVGRRTLTEPEARTVLEAAGVDFGPAVVARSAEGVAEALRALGGPVTVKLVSSAITHKSDAGGVVLGVSSEEKARAAYQAIREDASRYAVREGLDIEPDEELGVLVAPHLEPPRVELLVGAYRDPALGPMLTLGAGGVWVEALADVAVRLLPVDAAELRAMLAELRVAHRFSGGRGFPAIDLEPILDVAVGVAETVDTWPEIAEVEINPLFVYEDRAVPVDARIVLGERP